MATNERTKRHEFAAEYAVCQRKFVSLRMIRIYNTYIYIIIGTICTILLDSCNNERQSSNISRILDEHNDTITIEQVVTPNLPSRIIEDTIIGNWSLKVKISANDVMVGGEDCAVGDSSVLLTLAYKDNVLFDNEEIRTSDIVGAQGEGVYMMQWGGIVEFASKNSVYLSFGCFLPDTDDGWRMLYKIDKNGHTDLIVLDHEMGLTGYETVSDFFTYYFSERKDGIKISELKPLFERYCTDVICEKLLSEEITIECNDTNLSNALKTFVIKLVENDSFYSDINELYTYSIEYKPNPNDVNITDIITIKVREEDSKIAELNSGERRII